MEIAPLQTDSFPSPAPILSHPQSPRRPIWRAGPPASNADNRTSGHARENLVHAKLRSSEDVQHPPPIIQSSRTSFGLPPFSLWANKSLDGFRCSINFLQNNRPPLCRPRY